LLSIIDIGITKIGDDSPRSRLADFTPGLGQGNTGLACPWRRECTDAPRKLV